MSTSPRHDVLTVAMLREAVEALRGVCATPHSGRISYIVHPIDTKAHIYLGGWSWAVKQFYRTWNNRTDYERMDGLAWLVRGVYSGGR